MTILNEEMARHDREAQALSNHAVLAATVDLWARKNIHNRRDQEHRWILERRAALLREVKRRKLSLV